MYTYMYIGCVHVRVHVYKCGCTYCEHVFPLAFLIVQVTSDVDDPCVGVNVELVVDIGGIFDTVTELTIATLKGRERDCVCVCVCVWREE